MGQLWTELRYAFRVLVRNGSASVLAILCLGLGIGLQATIFAAADPWHDAVRLAAAGPAGLGDPAGSERAGA